VRYYGLPGISIHWHAAVVELQDSIIENIASNPSAIVPKKRYPVAVVRKRAKLLVDVKG